jgi:hypothetical protein
MWNSKAGTLSTTTLYFCLVAEQKKITERWRMVNDGSDSKWYYGTMIVTGRQQPTRERYCVENEPDAGRMDGCVSATGN